MDYPEKGLCVIINMEEFSKGLDRREGSDCDVKSIEGVFEIIGFTVKVLTDETCPELLNSLKKVAEEDHSKRSCFVCVIMSHGKEGKFFCSDNKSFEDDKLFDLFNGKNCRSLVGKPKVFFLQVI
ncbi:hypothetical protein GDO78_013893 [Eleutherodactylus coqui]|uniref:Caspase family p20 domain-containing protein n=1 Tax=Eleutherodactylus coqui TaxID=57060 RepID=A0A8J6B725_ELECQ|nr:hypothetical protein GDO78_013893 [Eleutherodactylus coqui]